MTHSTHSEGYVLLIGILIAALAVVAGGTTYYLRTPTPGSEGTETPSAAIDAARDTAAMLEKDAEDKTSMGEDGGTADTTGTMKQEEKVGASMEEQDRVGTPTNDKPVEPTPAVAAAGSYEVYTADKLAKAASGDVVLFFHAPWCPTCRAADSALSSSAGRIPSGLTILKTDYDTNTKLRQMYGVTSQHTFVQVDADGKSLKKWSGGTSVDAIVAQVQ